VGTAQRGVSRKNSEGWGWGRTSRRPPLFKRVNSGTGYNSSSEVVGRRRKLLSAPRVLSFFSLLKFVELPFEKICFP